MSQFDPLFKPHSRPRRRRALASVGVVLGAIALLLQIAVPGLNTAVPAGAEKITGELFGAFDEHAGRFEICCMMQRGCPPSREGEPLVRTDRLGSV